MPYRVDIRLPSGQAVDRLIELRALDIDYVGEELAAVLPDDVPADSLEELSHCRQVKVSPVFARDSGSVWLLRPTAVQVGALLIAPQEFASGPQVIRLADSVAFGTGHHATTVLCLKALQTELAERQVASMLDIGTGSGILALAALLGGVPRATGLDIDGEAIAAARTNAELNELDHRLELAVGEPRDLREQWPLIVANLLPAPLIDMAPDVARILTPRGMLILSGIQQTLQADVRRAYERIGVNIIGAQESASWVMLLGQASW